ncbi:hypothetical protein SANTM175S_07867 [Streptomyces antimycoticus]
MDWARSGPRRSRFTCWCRPRTSRCPFPFEDGTILDAVDVGQMGFDSTLTHCVKDDDPESQDSLIA